MDFDDILYQRHIKADREREAFRDVEARLRWLELRVELLLGLRDKPRKGPVLN